MGGNVPHKWKFPAMEKWLLICSHWKPKLKLKFNSQLFAQPFCITHRIHMTFMLPQFAYTVYFYKRKCTKLWKSSFFSLKVCWHVFLKQGSLSTWVLCLVHSQPKTNNYYSFAICNCPNPSSWLHWAPNDQIFHHYYGIRAELNRQMCVSPVCHDCYHDRE